MKKNKQTNKKMELYRVSEKFREIFVWVPRLEFANNNITNGGRGLGGAGGGPNGVLA